MIRSPQALAVAVRRSDGRIVLKREPIMPFVRRHPLLGVPLIRGAFALADALVTGMRALSFSADVAMEEERERAAAEVREDSPGDEGIPSAFAAPAPIVTEVGEAGVEKGLPAWSLASSLLFSLAVVVVVFVMFPDAMANLLRGHLPAGGAANAAINLVEGLLRVVLFIGYILAIGRMQVIRRVFEYHGAEHQVVYAFESGGPVTPETASRFDTAHPRCGTSFLAVVVLVSILAFSLLDIHTWYIRQGLKLLLLPLIGGISYEIIRLAGAGHLAFLVAPGLWLQRLTTRRPARDQVEVAIVALQGVLEQEGRTLNRAAETAGD